MEFPQAYRAHVLPRLKPRFDLCGALIASGVSDFCDEAAILRRTAWRLGGSRLPDDLWNGLEEWIDSQLLASLDRLEKTQKLAPALRDIYRQFAELLTENQALRDEIAMARHDLAMVWIVAAYAGGTAT